MADAELPAAVVAAINGMWIFVAGIICFMLQAGFGLLEAGAVRAKNAQNIMIKNLLDACVAALSYWLVGYGFAYGDNGNSFIGSGYYVFSEDDYIGWFFQYVFAGTTATIVSGAVAERCQFQAYLVYSCALTAFIYPVVSHWIWHPDGFLFGNVYDYAGGGAVHGVGGVAALCGAFFLGPRIGRFVKNEETGKWESHPIPGHNLVLSALGAFILWFGFFAFNGASGYDIATPEGYITTGRVAVVTTLAGSTGALTILGLYRFKDGTWDMMQAMNGLLAGMITTCSGVAAYEPWAAIIVGFTGALAYYAQEWVTINVCRIDDPLSAAALHMGSGFWGTFIVAFLAKPEFAGEEFKGIFYGGGIDRLGWQLAAIAVYATWAAGTSSIMFFTLKSLNMLRVDEATEKMGLDLHHHGGVAYRIPSFEDKNLPHQALDVSDTVPAEKVAEKEEAADE